jgi:hypothetical protein
VIVSAFVLKRNVFRRASNNEICTAACYYVFVLCNVRQMTTAVLPVRESKIVNETLVHRPYIFTLTLRYPHANEE